VSRIKELEPAAPLGLAGATTTEYPAEDRRYDQPEYEPFWAAAAALDLPLSLHTATRRQRRIRGAGDKTLRDASSSATKAFYLLSGAADRRRANISAERRNAVPATVTDPARFQSWLTRSSARRRRATFKLTRYRSARGR
jgi:hypothetical protein